MAGLPEDVVSRILLHLPFEALVRGGSVCRAWRRLVEEVVRERQGARWCVLCCPVEGEEARLWMYDPLCHRWLRVPAPRLHASGGTSVRLVQSAGGCDGLVGMLEVNEEERHKSGVWVGNPATGRWLRLPAQDLVAGEYQLVVEREGYQVVNIGTLRERGQMVAWRAEVYSSVTGRWRKGRAIFVSHCFRMVMGASTVADGTLYLMGIVQDGCRHKIEIIAYHLQQDTFRTLNFRSPCPLDLRCGWDSFQLLLAPPAPGVHHPRLHIVARNWEEGCLLKQGYCVSKACLMECDEQAQEWVLGETTPTSLVAGHHLSNLYLSTNRSPNPFLVYHLGSLQWCLLPHLGETCVWHHSSIATFHPRLDACF